MFSVFQKKLTLKNFNETLRFYAQSKKAKEAKKAAKSKDQLEKEKKRKEEKKKEEEKKAAKKEKRSLKKEENQTKEKGASYRSKFETPAPKPYLPLPDQFFENGKFKEYLSSLQNLNFSSRTGYFGFGELENPESFKIYQTKVFNNLENIMKKNFESMSSTEFLSYLREIDSFINDLLFKSQLVYTFIPFELFVTQAVTIKNLTDAFYEQNLVPNFEKYYKKLKQHEKEFSSEDLLYVNRKLLVYEQRGAHLSLDEKLEFLSYEYDFRDKKESFEKSIKEIFPISIINPTKFFELPKEIYHTIPKKIVQKKRTAILDNNVQQDVMRIVTNPFVRKDIAKKSRDSLYDPKSSFHSNLKVWSQKAKELALSRGFKNFAQYKQKEENIWDINAVENHLSSFVLNLSVPNYITKFSQTHHEKFDFQLLEEQDAQKLKKFNSLALSEFFNVPSLFESIDHLSRNLFGIELVEEKLKIGETWNPKNIKKFTLKEGEKDLGTVYLDLFEGKVNKPKITQAVYGSHNNVAVISCNFREGIVGYPTLLSHENVRDVLKVFSEIVYNFKTKHHQPIIREVFKGLFTYYSSHPQFLKKLSHYSKNTPLFEEYIQDLVSTRPYSFYQIVKEATYSLIDIELFTTDVKNTDKLIRGKESEVVSDNMELLPHFDEFREFGGKYYQKIYSKMISSQIWNEKLNKGEEKMDFNLFFQTKQAKEILKEILGSEVPKYEFLINDIKLH